jgi:hypothetical protein
LENCTSSAVTVNLPGRVGIVRGEAVSSGSPLVHLSKEAVVRKIKPKDAILENTLVL